MILMAEIRGTYTENDENLLKMSDFFSAAMTRM